MNSDNEYHIREKIEDEFVRSIAAMAKEVLKENDILEDIIQKYGVTYNMTLKKRCSARSLQVMNENHKPIFSTITSSGVIKSPRCSSASAKKDAKFPSSTNRQFRTPLKTNRINSSTERKRLSFDIPGNDYMNPSHAFSEHFYDSQTIVTNSEKESTTSRVAVDDTCRQLDTGSSFFYNDEEPEIYRSPEERLNLDAKREDVTSLSTKDQDAANPSTEGPDDSERLRITPEKGNITQANSIVEETKAWYLGCRPSFFTFNLNPEALDSTDNLLQERFSVDGKPETITSCEIYDNACVSPKTLDNHNMMFSTNEIKNSALVKNTAVDGKSSECLTMSPSLFRSKENTTISDKPNTNEQICADEKLGTVSTSYKTPDKVYPMSDDANNQEKTLVNQIRVKKVTINIAPNDHERTPTNDVEKSNNPKTNKRKSVDYSEEALVVTSSLASDDQEFKVLPKISKLDNYITMIHKKTASSAVSVMDGYDSICPTDKSIVDENIPFHHAMNYKDSFNRTEDFMNEQGAAQPDKKLALPLNDNQPEVMSVSPAITMDSASYSPENDQIKTSAKDKSDVSNSKNDQIQTSSAVADKTEGVELLTNLMKNLSPSVKRSSDSSFQKSITKESVSDNPIWVGRFRLRDNISETTTPPREKLISYVQSPKPNSVDPAQALKFVETAIERKTRTYMYLHLFIEDRGDLRFICAYIKKLTAVVEKIPTDEHNEVKRAVNDFSDKASKLLNKATSWELDTEKDIEVWESCLQNIKKLLYEFRNFREGNKRFANPKKCQEWEARFRIICKKADDMTLLREIRRPTILQFGDELESLIQLFIGCLLALGLFK